MNIELQERTHTKGGFQMHLVIIQDRLEPDEFKALTSTARAAGGWYSRRWKQCPGGFAFKDKGIAEGFIKSVKGE